MAEGVTKREQYVLARLEGHGTREAARRAGFSGGAPSPGARRLWERVEEESRADVDERRRELQQEAIDNRHEIQRLKWEQNQIRRKLEAVRVLDKAGGVDKD